MADGLKMIFYPVLIILGLLVLIIWLDKPRPEFHIDGIAYYTRKTCLEQEVVNRMKPHYYPGHNGSFKIRYMPSTETVCKKYRLDTLEFKSHAKNQ